MTPAGLLNWARAVLDHPELGLEGTWSRASALLARQALEAALDEYWDREFPPVKETSRRTQLALLGAYVGTEGLAHSVRAAWMALTRACHHHPYELDPVAAELESWFTEVQALIDQLHTYEGISA